MKTSAYELVDRMVVRYPPLEVCRIPALKAAELICECHGSGGKLLLAGNGGSASDCEHIVGEFVKSFELPRLINGEHRRKLQNSGIPEWEHLASHLQEGVSAISLTGHSSLSTAIQNDTGADMVFAQQVYVHGRKHDILIGMSTSGNSRNILQALIVAKAFGLTTIGFTGANKAAMDPLCDVLIKAPATRTPEIQEFHLPIYHAICLAVEQELFGI